MTYGEVEEICEKGLEVEMSNDGKRILGVINFGDLSDEMPEPDLGKIFDREEAKRIESDTH
jgi:hypothetical protein